METLRTKYPRTYHVSWSEGATNDDKTHDSLDMFVGQEVVVTAKLDGENSSCYPDGYVHARSMDSAHHDSRAWLKQFAASWSRDLPAGWRVTGENLFARHAIFYTALPSYLMVFGIWDEQNTLLSWDQMVEWCQLLGLTPVPVVYRGIWDEKMVRGLYPFPSMFGETVPEGYVIRLASAFKHEAFTQSTAKFVRKGHVQKGTTHWAQTAVIPNLLAVSSDTEPGDSSDV